MSWLASWLFNPVMFWVGLAAVLSPVIIHLLNRRRFRIVDWAAMDFLLDADKKNRRRVRMENLILLLLRCLAVLLLGLLLARPFLPSQLAGLLGQSQDFQRVVLLDDSLSQQVAIGNQTAFDLARDRLKQLLQSLASDDGNDWLTLYLTSQPDDPVIANEPVTGDSLNSLIARVDELPCSQSVAAYDQALLEIGGFVEDSRSTANKVVYVFSDMRRRDWQGDSGEDQENAPHRLLASLAETTPNTFLVDVGSPLEENLTITGIAVDDLLVADTVVRFQVTVRNHGDTTAEDVQLRFRVDDGQPQTGVIASIPPGETGTVTFRHMFQFDREAFAELDVQDQLLGNTLNARVRVDVVQQGATRDFLLADSEHFLAARVLKGLPILIVDGDPSPVEERSESYYLQGIGLSGTGLLVDTATVGELETVSLGKYRVIFLCNVDEASSDRVNALRQWVSDGGGLVFFPGDRVRASTFNQTFYRDGRGLSPLRLESAEGDATRGNWVFMELQDAAHPAFRVALDEDVGMGQVEVFSWWRTAIADSEEAARIATPLRLSDPDGSPAMAEKTLGDGRVITFAFPADADWTMWAAHPTYVCVMWDMVNYLVGNQSGASRESVGQTLTRLVDLTLHEQDVSLTDPGEEKIQSQAYPLDDTREGAESSLYQVEFPPLALRGFWKMELQRRDGQADPVLYAANVNPDEGDLRRIDVLSLPDAYFGENTRLVSADDLILQNETGTSNEIWPQLLLILAGILCLEQLLGWAFGRRR